MYKNWDIIPAAMYSIHINPSMSSINPDNSTQKKKMKSQCKTSTNPKHPSYNTENIEKLIELVRSANFGDTRDSSLLTLLEPVVTAVREAQVEDWVHESGEVPECLPDIERKLMYPVGMDYI
jgi:hypothetical protein